MNLARRPDYARKKKPRIGDARPVAVSGEMGRLPGLSHNAVPLPEFPGTNALAAGCVLGGPARTARLDFRAMASGARP